MLVLENKNPLTFDTMIILFFFYHTLLILSPKVTKLTKKHLIRGRPSNLNLLIKHYNI